MASSSFLDSIPPFVWVGLIGMVVCFFVGYLSLPSIMEHRDSGSYPTFQIAHDLDVVLWTALGLAFVTVVTCFKYSVVMPESFFLRLLVFPLIILGTVVLMFLFWGVSVFAANVYLSTHHIPKKR